MRAGRSTLPSASSMTQPCICPVSPIASISAAATPRRRHSPGDCLACRAPPVLGLLLRPADLLRPDRRVFTGSRRYHHASAYPPAPPAFRPFQRRFQETFPRSVPVRIESVSASRQNRLLSRGFRSHGGHVTAPSRHFLHFLRAAMHPMCIAKRMHEPVTTSRQSTGNIELMTPSKATLPIRAALAVSGLTCLFLLATASGAQAQVGSRGEQPGRHHAALRLRATSGRIAATGHARRTESRAPTPRLVQGFAGLRQSHRTRSSISPLTTPSHAACARTSASSCRPARNRARTASSSSSFRRCFPPSPATLPSRSSRSTSPPSVSSFPA